MIAKVPMATTREVCCLTKAMAISAIAVKIMMHAQRSCQCARPYRELLTSLADHTWAGGTIGVFCGSNVRSEAVGESGADPAPAPVQAAEVSGAWASSSAEVSGASASVFVWASAEVFLILNWSICEGGQWFRFVVADRQGSGLVKVVRTHDNSFQC